MVRDMDHLKEQIIRKNEILKNCCKGSDCPNRETIDKLLRELDGLLYEYCKLHKCQLCKRSLNHTGSN